MLAFIQEVPPLEALRSHPLQFPCNNVQHLPHYNPPPPTLKTKKKKLVPGARGAESVEEGGYTPTHPKGGGWNESDGKSFREWMHR